MTTPNFLPIPIATRKAILDVIAQLHQVMALIDGNDPNANASTQLSDLKTLSAAANTALNTQNTAIQAASSISGLP